MSASILITAGGKKGAAPRRLKHAVREKLERARDEGLSEELARVVEGSERAANKLIPLAPAGSVVSVQIELREDPFGRWGASVLVDVEAAPMPATSRGEG